MGLATPTQAMFVPQGHLPYGETASGGLVALIHAFAVDGGFAAKGSSLHSAALIRQYGLRFTSKSESSDVSQAALRAHFSEVISILLRQSKKNLAVAVERLRMAHGDGWSRAEHERWSTILRVNRALQIERLRQYARRGLFPINEHHSSGPIPIFVDRHDTACAVGHLMRESGWNDAVEEIARHNNHVYVPDAYDGPLVDWVLQSGLTQEEAGLIQPAYGPSCRPFADLNLDGIVDWSDAEVHDLSGWDFRGMDLTGAFDLMEYAWPCDYNLTAANLSGQNLANAALSYSTLTGADLSGAVVIGAWFNTSLGFTKEQLYSTASYQAKDLSGIGFDNSDLSGWDLSGQNLTRAFFSVSNLSNANLTGADTRDGSLSIPISGAVSRNTILPNGFVTGFELAAGEKMLVRDYDGWLVPDDDGASFSELPVPVRIEDHLRMAEGSILQLLFDADPWGSMISFGEPYIPVQLGGALELTFADDVNLASQVGRTLRIFDWSDVSPRGQFAIHSPYLWDASNLYTTGEVKLLAIPEPSAAMLLMIGVLLGLWNRVFVVNSRDW
jgi:uncharacterized protein YjbI with pentapeptide repeats